MKTYDVIVIGSGIAGLSFALKVGRLGYSVALITKKTKAESNTNYAQGGIATVTSSTDDFDLHVADTLDAGDGLCDEAVVRQIVAAGPERIAELVQIGVDFTMLGDGRPSLGKEGGHSKRRILHVKDLTGAAIEAALLEAVAGLPQIDMLEHHMAIDLITSHKLANGVASSLGGENGNGGEHGNGAEHTNSGEHTNGGGNSNSTEAGKGSGVQAQAAGVSRSLKALLNEPNRVLGLYALNTQSGVVETFAAPVVMLATGGVGQVYQYTTNPDIATGDGIAMAYRAGAQVRNMEFIQFHPTALYTLSQERFLVSEAVRGEGAVLRNVAGEAFMTRYDRRADLAPRDIVARAIDSEMKKSGSAHVWLDITHHSEEELRSRFPSIFEACERNGINMARDYIPVVPACHYLCGGVHTDMNARTGVEGLLACGEVACTGLHGANRLASNSLLEACVLAHGGAQTAHELLQNNPVRRRNPIALPAWIDGSTRDPDERVVLSHNLFELKHAMWDYVGIVRSTKRLQRARTRIANLKKEINDYYWNFKVEPALLELRNLIQAAELIVDCALQRHESRGLHYTLDYLEHAAGVAARDSVATPLEGGNL